MTHLPDSGCWTLAVQPGINSSQQETQQSSLSPTVRHTPSHKPCFAPLLFPRIAPEAEGLKPSVPQSRVHAQLGGCITVAPGWVFPPYQPGSGRQAAVGRGRWELRVSPGYSRCLRSQRRQKHSQNEWELSKDTRSTGENLLCFYVLTVNVQKPT